MRIIRYLLLPLLLFLLFPANGHAMEQGLFLGYGFAALNERTATGEVEGKKKYDFFQAAYFCEIPHWERVSFVVEPFVAYIDRPESGVDGGFDLLLRWYPFDRGRSGLFFDLGAGAAYTSIAFKEQGTHLLGILVGGIGFRYKAWFVEDRLRHYSNGHSAYPNRSVNANILCVGMYF
jgi:hypothetical protein